MTPFVKSVSYDDMIEGGTGFSFDGGPSFGSMVCCGIRLAVPAKTMLALFELAEEFHLTISRAEELGFAAARSAEMEMSTGPFLCFSDDQLDGPAFPGFSPGVGSVSIEDEGILFMLVDRSLKAEMAAYVEIDEIETYLCDVGLLPGETSRM